MGINAQKPESQDTLEMVVLKQRQLLVALSHPLRGWTGHSPFSITISSY